MDVLQPAQDLVYEKYAMREAEGLASADHSVEISVHDLGSNVELIQRVPRGPREEDLGDLYTESGQTLQRSFSAVSTPRIVFLDSTSSTTFRTASISKFQ